MLNFSPTLAPVWEKIVAGRRIDEDDALALFEAPDFCQVAAMAHHVRTAKNGGLASYILNRFINYSNVCLLSCDFCAYGAKARDAHAFTRSIPDMCAELSDALQREAISEVHIVGGLHPTLDAQWYLDMLRSIRALAIDPNCPLGQSPKINSEGQRPSESPSEPQAPTGRNPRDIDRALSGLVDIGVPFEGRCPSLLIKGFQLFSMPQNPNGHFGIKAFTAVELLHLARRAFKKSLPDTLALLRENGLDSITGGGAEIFDASVRQRICPAKETAEEWLDVHRTWHKMGGTSTATMLFGHIETFRQRVDHLRRLRELQDETGGFTGFVPFAFAPKGARVGSVLHGLPPASALDILRTIAVARVFLDNFPHITAYWVSMGLPLAQVALHCGADDLHGTIGKEKVFHDAGAQTPHGQSVEAFEAVIRGAGFTPVRRDTRYDCATDGA